MTTWRVSLLLLMFAGVALGVVYLRTEQARCASRALKSEARWIELRRDLWQVQSGVARLRAPGQVHDRLGWLQSDLVRPMGDEPARPKRIVSNRR